MGLQLQARRSDGEGRRDDSRSGRGAVRLSVGYITQGAELLVWTDDAWLENVRAWIDERLSERGSRRTAPIEQIQVRPWGTVLRAGDVYFKASTDTFEASLTEALARWAPSFTVPVLAVDHDRNWMLTRAGGLRMRELGPTPDALGRWEAAIAAYAQLQRALLSRASDLLSIGVPDQRLHTLPAQYDRLVDEIAGLESVERARFRTLAPRFAEMCERLAASEIASTLQHDEVHEGHVFIRDGGYAFFDWAEAVVSHPFLTLRGTLFSLADFFGVDRDDARLRRVVDVYLREWETNATRASIVDAFGVVDPVGAVCRALRWHAFVSRMRPPFAERYGHAPAAILRRFCDAF